MKQIGFIGTYDKIDLILYVAKIMRLTGKRILIVDSTTVQKAKYIVPAISPTVRYITEYEDMDVAVGFSNMEEIKKYLAINTDEHELKPEGQQISEVNEEQQSNAENNELNEEQDELTNEQNGSEEYDYVLIDADDYKGVEGFRLEKSDINYFITSGDCYTLKRGLEAFSDLRRKIKLIKVFFSKTMDKEENDYLDFLSSSYDNIEWDEQRIYFPFENGDLSVIHENQRVYKIKFKKLSVQYKDSLGYIAEQLLGNRSAGEVRKAIKSIEKGV